MVFLAFLFYPSQKLTAPVVKWTNCDFILFPAIFFIWYLPLYLYDWSPTRIHLPSVIQCGAPPGGHCWNNYLHWVESLWFIYGSGTRRFDLQMSGPQVGLGVSPIIKMPLWLPCGTHPDIRKLLVFSLCVHALPLWVAPMPAVKYDLNGGLPTSLRFTIYQEYMVIAYLSFFKTWSGIYIYFGWAKNFLNLSLSLMFLCSMT